MTHRFAPPRPLCLAASLAALALGPASVAVAGSAPGAQPVVHVAAGATAHVTAGVSAGVPAAPGRAPATLPMASMRVSYVSPTGGDPVVLVPFDAPAQEWLAGHRGVDLHLGDALPVRAPAPGVVAFAGSVAGRPVVSVDHPDGIRTSYEPVSTTLTAGAAVAAGDVLGTLVADPRLDSADATARAEGLHGPGVLHWGARARDDGGRWRYLDPMSLLRAPVIRLLPV